MAKKRVQLLGLVHAYLVANGLDKTASRLEKESDVSLPTLDGNPTTLEIVYSSYLKAIKNSNIIEVTKDEEVVSKKTAKKDALVEQVTKKRKIEEENPLELKRSKKSKTVEDVKEVRKEEKKAHVEKKDIHKMLAKKKQEEEEEEDDDDEEEEEDEEDDDEDEEDEEDEEDVVRRIEDARKKKAADSAKASELWLKKSTEVMPLKKPEKRSEPRVSGEAFRRVTDEWSKEIISGLEDNSYERQFGSDGYGAKASQVLINVRGKDFRHEKTKRKRGTYRGGAITLESNSFKYED